VSADTSWRVVYGITDPLIDVDRGVYEPVGIHEVPAFHSGKKMSCDRLLPFFIIVLVFLQKRTCVSFSVQTSFDSSAFVVSSVLWHSWKTLSARACECWINPNASSSIQCLDNNLYILMKFLISTCWALIRNFMIAKNCCRIVLGLYYVCTYHTLRGSPNLSSNLHLASNICHNTVKRVNLS
jgi:hypothetical protein